MGRPATQARRVVPWPASLGLSVSMRAAFPILLCASGCSLADLSGLSVGTGAGGGDGTTSSEAGSTITASGAQGSTATTSGGDGGGGGSSSSDVSTGSGASSGTGGAPPCEPGQMCAVRDDFEDGTVDGVWAPFGDCTRSVDAGAVVIDAFDEPGHYCGYSTTDAYDLRGQSIHVAVDEVTSDQVGSQTYLAVSDPRDALSIAVSKSGMVLQVENGGEYFTIQADHDHERARFWRIAGEGDELVFSIRGAAVADVWEEVYRTSNGVPDLSEIRVTFGLGTFQTVVDAGRGVFDCVNVPPEECP